MRRNTGFLSSSFVGTSTTVIPSTVVCHQRWCRVDVPHLMRCSQPSDACGEREPVRRYPRRFRRVWQKRGPRVTWAGMARSPRRLPRRPADSPALPLQHTYRQQAINVSSRFKTPTGMIRVTLTRSLPVFQIIPIDGDPRHPKLRGWTLLAFVAPSESQLTRF